MIGRFKNNIFILSKNIEINDFFKNKFYKIRKNKIILYSSAFALINDKIIVLQKGEYETKNISKILFSNHLNEESFLNEFVYENEEFICIHFYNLKFAKCKEFKTEYFSINEAERFVEDFLDKEFKNIKKEPVLLVFNELFFNAYEHGNLGVSFEEKEKLLKENKYLDFLKNSETHELIEICINKITYKNRVYFVCKITDEGEGFDILQKKEALYNGRGVLMSDRICNGVFYNEKGNSVLFFKEIK